MYIDIFHTHTHTHIYLYKAKHVQIIYIQYILYMQCFVKWFVCFMYEGGIKNMY